METRQASIKGASARPRCERWAASLGILVIENDPVPEAEIWAMAPADVTVHAARFESPTRSGREYTGSTWHEAVEAPDMARGLEQLGHLGVSAIGLCFGSGSFFGGRAFDDAFARQASAKATGTRVVTAARAIVAGLRATGVANPLVVMPPWFTRPTFEATERYLAEAGLGCAGLLPFELGAAWDGVEAHRLFDRGGRWEVLPDELHDRVLDGFPADADGVLVPGSGFRSREAVVPLERELGVPVVTSNQAVLWACLHLAGVGGDPGHGRLYASSPAPDDL